MLSVILITSHHYYWRWNYKIEKKSPFFLNFYIITQMTIFIQVKITCWKAFCIVDIIIDHRFKSAGKAWKSGLDFTLKSTCTHNVYDNINSTLDAQCIQLMDDYQMCVYICKRDYIHSINFTFLDLKNG